MLTISFMTARKDIVWPINRPIRGNVMPENEPCYSCKGSGLWSKTYEDVWENCEICDGLGEIDDEGD